MIKPLIVFDWDDTLFPTSHYNRRHLSKSFYSNLKDLEESIVSLLEFATERAPTFIITAAEKRWVELSVKKYFPRVASLMSERKVTVLSVRDYWSSCEDGENWKTRTFREAIGSTLLSGSETQILSVGDSHHEREAVKKVLPRYEDITFRKSIKFAERPTVELLKRQIDRVRKCMDEILECNKDLDLMLTIAGYNRSRRNGGKRADPSRSLASENNVESLALNLTNHQTEST